MKQIIIHIDQKGQTTVATRGFAGPSCRNASEFLEPALGKPTAEQMTGEFYQQEQASEVNR